MSDPILPGPSLADDVVSLASGMLLATTLVMRVYVAVGLGVGAAVGWHEAASWAQLPLAMLADMAMCAFVPLALLWAGAGAGGYPPGTGACAAAGLAGGLAWCAAVLRSRRRREDRVDAS